MTTSGWDALADDLRRADAQWSVVVRELGVESGVAFEFAAERALRSASTAKLLLLLAVARRIASGLLDPALQVDRTELEPVADSGVWWHLEQPDLSVADLARLVGMASDNLATNALIQVVGGVEEIAATTSDLGVRDVQLHDVVRDIRTPEHPETLSTGSARGYSELLAWIWTRAQSGDASGRAVLSWIRDSLDLSMVASSFGLDPLSHHQPDRGYRILNKTGTDDGVRVDAGVVSRNGRVIVYAALANWLQDEPGDEERDRVLVCMRSLGRQIRIELEQG